MSRTAKSAAKRTTPEQHLNPLRHTPGPDQFEQALRETQALADLLTGLSPDHSDETRALAARGVPIVDNVCGDPALCGSLASPFVAEFLRLQTVVAEVLTPEVLADYHRRKGLRRARAAAEYLVRAGQQFVAAVDGMPSRTLEALETNEQMARVAGLWIDAARSIAHRARPVAESAES